MNVKMLKSAEKSFLKEFPGGFKHPELVAVLEKHKSAETMKWVKASFNKSAFDDRQQLLDSMVKLVSRSTVISLFEKPKFKELANSLSRREQDIFVEALYELLHGKEKIGFEALLQELGKRKMAKWTVATILQSNYRPQKDVFVKPSTTKLVVNALELDLSYKSTPSWAFYRKYRLAIKELKVSVSKDLAPSNLAFCGFLMTALKEN